MYTYRYTGSNSTAFIWLQKNGSTWVPEPGDTIDSPTSISHILLELIDSTPADEAPSIADEPVATEALQESADDSQKEN